VGGGPPPPAGGGRGQASISEYGANRLVVDVEADGPALAVLTDTFYPGWRAWLDGRPVSIHRVDGVVRGVFVERGRHRLEMRFRPLSHLIGLTVTAVASVVVALMAVAGGLRLRTEAVGDPDKAG
jgi:uncharacterized membrane protein YfhO